MLRTKGSLNHIHEIDVTRIPTSGIHISWKGGSQNSSPMDINQGAMKLGSKMLEK